MCDGPKASIAQNLEHVSFTRIFPYGRRCDVARQILFMQTFDEKGNAIFSGLEESTRIPGRTPIR